MINEKYVHGIRVMFEEDAVDGYRYLDQRLEKDFAKVFFVYAQHYKTAPFEDHMGRKFLLSYNGHDKYILSRK